MDDAEFTFEMLERPALPSLVEELSGVTKQVKRGWKFAKSRSKTVLQILSKKEKRSLAELEARIKSEKDTFCTQLKHTDVDSVIKASMECLEEFNLFYDGKLFNKQYLEETRMQFEKKYMIIGVVGRFKSGKSTLLNALLQSEILPCGSQKETAYPVTISHNRNKHFGPCLEKCRTTDSQESAECPQLTIEWISKPSSTFCGQEEVKKKLRKLNTDARRKPNQVPKNVSLEMHIPFLSKGAGDTGVQAVLKDMAGFGAEESEEIKETTTQSILSSSLLVYVLSCSNLEDQMDAATLKALCNIDEKIIERGRILIAATHFDNWTDSASDDEGTEHEEEGASASGTFFPNLYLNRGVVQERVLDFFVKATGLSKDDMPVDNICPLSSVHAVTAYKAEHQPSESNKVKVESALRNCYSKYSTSRGKTPPLDTGTLWNCSLVPHLEDRLEVLLRDKDIIWRSAIISSVKWHLEISSTMLGEMLQEKRKEYEALKSDVDYKTTQENKLEELESKLSDGKEVYKALLEESCEQSMQELMREIEEDLTRKFDKFHQECTAKSLAKDGYHGHEYTQDLDKFLHDTSEGVFGLVKKTRFEVLDTNNRAQYEDTVGLFNQLWTTARVFCSGNIQGHQKDMNRLSVGNLCGRSYPISLEEATDAWSDAATAGRLPAYNEAREASEVLKSDLGFWTRIRFNFLKIFGKEPDLQAQELSGKKLDQKLDQARVALFHDTQGYFPLMKKGIVGYYLDHHERQVDSGLKNFHDKKGTHVNVTKKELKRMRNVAKSKDKLCTLLEQEKGHCQELISKLRGLEHMPTA